MELILLQFILPNVGVLLLIPDDLDVLEIPVLQHVAHGFAQLGQDSPNLLRRHRLVHVVSTHLPCLPALLVDQVTGVVILVDVGREVHVRSKGN